MTWLSNNSDGPPVTQENVCLRCLQRPIWGKPYTVYVCFECDQWHCFNCGNDLPCPLHHSDGTSE